MRRNEPTPEEQERWDLAQIKQGNSRLFARPIKSIVRRLLSKEGYGAIESMQQLLDQWPSIVGGELAKVTRPQKVSRGVLLVLVRNSQANHEINFQKTKILTAVQAAAPGVKLNRVRFQVVEYDE